MKKILLLLLLFNLSCSAKELDMNNKDLYQIVENSLTDKDYARSLREADDYDFVRLNSIFLKGVEIYRFVDMDPSRIESNFIFALNKERNKAYLLTESVANLNQIISTSDIDLTVQNASEYVLELLSFLRPPYKYFELIDSKEKAEDWLTKLDLNHYVPEQLIMEKNSEGELKGSILILIGRDLIQREVTLTEGQLSFSDKVVSRNVSRYYSPHNYHKN